MSKEEAKIEVESKVEELKTEDIKTTEEFKKAVAEGIKQELEKIKAETQGVPESVKKSPKSKMVKIKLFKDNGEYKDDVFVAVNGKRYQIQRGIEVEVPDFVKEVLDNSEKQDRKTAELIEREAAKANTVPQ